MYEKRITRVAEWMEREGIACAVLEDTEGRRTSGLRYLSGMNQDALLFVFASGATVLVPWDETMARKIARADEIIPYTDFNRDFPTALAALLIRSSSFPSARIEICAATPHPVYSELCAAFPETEILCRRNGISDYIDSLKMIKDQAERDILRQACAITDSIIEGLSRRFTENSLETELDAALYIETEARRLGAEGSGFDIIAAGPSRSFGIHAFPSYSGASLKEPGLSILDFGVRYQGYTSDVTMTVVRGKTSEKQELMISLVEEAYAFAEAEARIGADTRAIAKGVDKIFARHGFTMPHSLGHGIGLDVHEEPLLRSRGERGTLLEEGMVFTLEPGLYDPEEGGVRLENDILLEKDGPVTLTRSRILRIP